MDIAESVRTENIVALLAHVHDECICQDVQQLHRLVTRVYDEAIRPSGITSAQFTLLCIIATKGATKAATIGCEIDMEKSTLSRNLKRLHDIDCIQIGQPRGRYGKSIMLTVKGEAILRTSYPLWKAVNAKCKSLLGEDATLKIASATARANAVLIKVKR